MTKIKDPVVLPLLGELDDYYNDASTKSVSRVGVKSGAQRTISPSPPSSPGSSRRDSYRKHVLSEVSSAASEQTLHSVKKRKVSGRWDPSSIELVDSELDLSIAAMYDMLLFSHMVMNYTTANPSFCCRLCDGKEVFECRSATSISSHVPSMEYHIMTCSGSPHWLKQVIWKNKGRGDPKQTVEYSGLLWKRMMAYRIPKARQSRVVHFAEHHQAILIPRCNAGRPCRRVHAEEQMEQCKGKKC